MNITIINGPNLNMLGIREPGIYGKESYESLVGLIKKTCSDLGIEVKCFQSNHEGAIVDEIHSAYGVYDGIVIYPVAYTHTSIAILDALKAVGLPAVEVHISNVHSRDEFRHKSVISAVCKGVIAGFGKNSYILGLYALMGEIG